MSVVRRHDGERAKHVASVALWAAMLTGVAGCPNSPLYDLLTSGGTSDGGIDTPATDVDLPTPTIVSSGLQGENVRLEWTVDESDERYANIVGFSVYRSTSKDSGFVIRRSVARFEELVFFDTDARGGNTYYYYVVATDRLGREGPKSDTATVILPPGEDQVVVRVSDPTGTLAPSRFGVSDLNAGGDDLTDEAVRTDLAALGVHWWRVSMARWDPGDFLDEDAIIEREFFVGNTIDEARDPAYYNFTYLDRVIAHIVDAGITPIVCIDTMPRSLARNSDVVFRAPVLSWSDNVRNSPPADNAVFAEVVKRVIMHYTQGWADGQTLDLPYWELGNQPDLDEQFDGAAGTFWAGTMDEFIAMYAACHQAVKAEFGDAVKFGGASFVTPAAAGAFLDDLADQEVTPDFVSFFASSDQPAEVALVAAGVADELAARDLDNVEMIASSFSMSLPVAGLSDNGAFFAPQAKFDSMLHVIHYLTTFKLLSDVGASIGLHEGCLDRTTGLNLGLRSRSADFVKPVGVALQALQGFTDHPNRVSVAPSAALALAGVNDDQNSVLILLGNPDGDPWAVTLDVVGLPWSATTTFDWSLDVLTDDAFAAEGDFSGHLGGTTTGNTLALQPVLPAYSLMRLTLQIAPSP